jgi:hypothetical protein
LAVVKRCKPGELKGYKNCEMKSVSQHSRKSYQKEDGRKRDFLSLSVNLRILWICPVILQEQVVFFQYMPIACITSSDLFTTTGQPLTSGWPVGKSDKRV